MSQERDNLELVLAGWVDALRRGDLEAIESHLHPDVVWHGLRAGLSCADREQVLANLHSTLRELPDVDAIDLTADGDQVLFGARSPDFTEMYGVDLDGEVFNLFTVRDGLIVEMHDFATREAALEAMSAHRLAATAADRAPAASRTPPQPVGALVPFAHVADVERSIAFYELLGFSVVATHGRVGQLGWASLQAGDARLMVARAEEAVDPATQAVLFYLYTADLDGLQQHLRAHGHRAGGIRDGSPGPKREMRVRDPDGYVLMIAET